MMNRLICLFFLCFVLLPNRIRCTDLISQKITLVDQLTKDYLRAEKELWKVIERREDSTLQQIYNVHTEFLNRQYGESNILLNGKHLNKNQIVISSVNAINETSHDIAREFFEHRNYTVLSLKAFDGITLDKTFQQIYNETINSTKFWNSLKNVSKTNQFIHFFFFNFLFLQMNLSEENKPHT